MFFYALCLQLRVQHEKYPANSEQVARLVLLVHELEVRDRLRQSNINKLLYQYTTEASPRQSHAHMVSHCIHNVTYNLFNVHVPI